MDTRNIIVLDLETRTIVENIKMPGFWAQANEMIFSSDGQRMFTLSAGQVGARHIVVIDTETKKIAHLIPLLKEYKAGFAPNGPFIAISPDEQFLYVSGISGIYRVNIESEQVTKISDIGRIVFLAFTAKGEHILGTNVATNSLDIIDPSSGRLVDSIPVGDSPQYILISPDGQRVYISNWESGDVSVVDLGTRKVIATVPIGVNPLGMTITPNGSKLYVAVTAQTLEHVEGKRPFKVVVVNTTTNTVVKEIMPGILGAPRFVNISPDGTKVYVNEYQGREAVNVFNIDLGSATYMESPSNKIVGEMYRQGQIPLWDPYHAAGMPLAAQYSSRVFFPYQIIEDMCPYWSWDYFMLLRLLIAGLGSYLFLRALALSTASAFLGGLFYMFSGSMIWFLNFEELVNVAMLIPLFLFCLERLLQTKSFFHTAMAAAIAALVILGGQPEVALYTFLLGVCYYAVRAFLRQRQGDSLVGHFLRLMTVLVLGIGLSAPQLFTFLEYAGNAYTPHLPGTHIGMENPAQPFYAFSIAWPNFFAYPTYERVLPNNGYWDWLGGYLGILPIFLASLGLVLSLMRKDSRNVLLLFFWAMGTFILMKNFGVPIIEWFGRLPLFEQVWSPRWSGPTWVFCFTMAGALGSEEVMAAFAGQETIKQMVRKAVIWVLAGLGSLLLIFTLVNLAPLREFLAGLHPAVQRPFFISSVLNSAFLTFSVLTLTILFIFSRQKRRLGYSIILLAVIELWFWIPRGYDLPWLGLKLIPLVIGLVTVALIFWVRLRWILLGVILLVTSMVTIDSLSPYGFPNRYDPFTRAPYIDFLQQNQGYHRVIGGEGVLMPNYPGVFGIYDARFISSLSIESYEEFISNYLYTTHALYWPSSRLWFTGMASDDQPPQGGLPDLPQGRIDEQVHANLTSYSLLGVKYILMPANMDAYLLSRLPMVYNNEIAIYENPQVCPRAFVVHHIEYAGSFRKAQDITRWPDFNPVATAVLEEQAPSWFRNLESVKSDSSAVIKKYEPNKIIIEVKAEDDGLLVLTDVYYPGWEVSVNGQPAKIYRADGLVRGVFVNRGEHSVVFTYFPQGFFWGLVVCFASLAVVLGLIVAHFLIYRRKMLNSGM